MTFANWIEQAQNLATSKGHTLTVSVSPYRGFGTDVADAMCTSCGRTMRVVYAARPTPYTKDRVLEGLDEISPGSFVFYDENALATMTGEALEGQCR